jgi:hypothetical protein
MNLSEKVRQAAERLAASPEYKERQRKITAAHEQLKHIELPSVMAAPAGEWPKDQRSSPAEMRKAWAKLRKGSL